MGGDAEDKGLVGAIAEGVTVAAPIGLASGAAQAFLAGHSPGAKAAAAASARGATQAIAGYTPPLTQIAGVTGAFAGVGAVYAATEQIVRTSRGTDDSLNKAIAGCAAGSVVGIRTGSAYAGGGACAAFAAMSAFLDLMGGTAGPVVNETWIKRKKIYEVSE